MRTTAGTDGSMVIGPTTQGTGTGSVGTGLSSVRSSLRECAAEYALQGWAIFPLWPKSKRPHSSLVPCGMDEASDFPGDALYWWDRAPFANIGLHCRRSGLIVLDIDPRNGGSIAEHERRLGALPFTAEQQTP